MYLMENDRSVLGIHVFGKFRCSFNQANVILDSLHAAL